MLLVVLLIFNKKKIFVPLRYTTCFNSYRFMCAHRLTLTNPRLHTTFSSYFYFYPSLLLYSHSYLFRNSYPENYRFLRVKYLYTQ